VNLPLTARGKIISAKDGPVIFLAYCKVRINQGEENRIGQLIIRARGCLEAFSF
jgi:hypothetical protein